jgi:hypothetical protein
MERILFPHADLALPVSTGPESSSVSDLAHNGSVTGVQDLRHLACLVVADIPAVYLSHGDLYRMGSYHTYPWHRGQRRWDMVRCSGTTDSAAVGLNIQPIRCQLLQMLLLSLVLFFIKFHSPLWYMVYAYPGRSQCLSDYNTVLIESLSRSLSLGFRV